MIGVVAAAIPLRVGSVEDLRADVARILAERVLDEPFDHGAELVVLAYEGDEPAGLVAGRLYRPQGADPPLACFEHLIVRPATPSGGVRRGIGWAVYHGWLAEARARGARQAIARVPTRDDPRVLLRIPRQGPRPAAGRPVAGRVARRLGWVPYSTGPDFTFWYIDL